MVVNIVTTNISQVYLPDCCLRHICDVQAVEDSPQDAKPSMDEVDPLGKEDKMDADVFEALVERNIDCTSQGAKRDSPTIPAEPGMILVSPALYIETFVSYLPQQMCLESRYGNIELKIT